MSALNDLIAQIADSTLRERIQHEVDRLTRQKKFGLVFESHLPECTPLYDMPIRPGALVAVRGQSMKDIYVVQGIKELTCERGGYNAYISYLSPSHHARGPYLSTWRPRLHRRVRRTHLPDAQTHRFCMQCPRQ